LLLQYHGTGVDDIQGRPLRTGKPEGGNEYIRWTHRYIFSNRTTNILPSDTPRVLSTTNPSKQTLIMKFNNSTLSAGIFAVLAFASHASAANAFRDTEENVYENTHPWPNVKSSQALGAKLSRDEPKPLSPALQLYGKVSSNCHRVRTILTTDSVSSIATRRPATRCFGKEPGQGRNAR
jgi:hypothetical protein